MLRTSLTAATGYCLPPIITDYNHCLIDMYSAPTMTTLALVNRAERGFVLVLSLGLLAVVFLTLLYLFNVGQLLSSKARLNNAADAAAYSAAVWRARVMNFQAYANRAILAQEVAVAQAVTLASWARYFDTLRQRAEPELRTGYPGAEPLFHIAPEAARAARAATERAAALEVWLRAAPAQGYKSQLLASQEALQHSAGTFGLGALANEVARASDSHFFAFALPDQGAFEALSQRYRTVPERSRLADLVLASIDDFSREPRSLNQDLLHRNSCSAAVASERQQFRKRGATELSADLDRWQAADTGSIHTLVEPATTVARGRLVNGCLDIESPPMGWGAFVAAPIATLTQLDSTPSDGAQLQGAQVSGARVSGAHLASALAAIDDNPVAAARAQQQLAASTSDPLPEYDGIAAVRELSGTALSQTEPVYSSLAVLARLEGHHARTIALPRLGNRSALAGDKLWALAAAQVYFRRPAIEDARVEFASLYSPYWQARLVPATPLQRQLAQSYVH